MDVLDVIIWIRREIKILKQFLYSRFRKLKLFEKLESVQNGFRVVENCVVVSKIQEMNEKRRE